MPYTKEQLKEYYLQRKAELNQRRSERRRLARLGQIKLSEVATAAQVETPTENELKQVETSKEVETPKLWANYYRTKKPYCWRCDYSGIKPTEYRYCSEEQEYNQTFNKYFDQCLIKHWEKHNQIERIN